MPPGHFRVHGSDFSGVSGSCVSLASLLQCDMTSIHLLLVLAMVMPQACPPFPPSVSQCPTCSQSRTVLHFQSIVPAGVSQSEP